MYVLLYATSLHIHQCHNAKSTANYMTIKLQAVTVLVTMTTSKENYHGN